MKPSGNGLFWGGGKVFVPASQNLLFPYNADNGLWCDFALYGRTDGKIVKSPPSMLQNVTGNFLASIRHFWSSLHTEDPGRSRKYDFVGRKKDVYKDCWSFSKLTYLHYYRVKNLKFKCCPLFILCSAPDQSIFILGSEKWAISC